MRIFCLARRTSAPPSAVTRLGFTGIGEYQRSSSEVFTWGIGIAEGAASTREQTEERFGGESAAIGSNGSRRNRIRFR